MLFRSLDESDSNPYSTDLNPNSIKGYFDGLIRIPGEERSEAERHEFEFLKDLNGCSIRVN